MADITLLKVDELYMKVVADPGICYEMSEHFSYFAEGYKFMPQFKSGSWDGKIKLFNANTKKIYCGLIKDVRVFGERYGYTVEVSQDLSPMNMIPDLKAFVKQIPDIAKLTPYDYQMEAFIGSIVENKCIVLSPTASGKSFMIYLITRFLMEHVEGKILIVVPSVTLVEQMVGDFVSYDPQGTFDEYCHKIRSGAKKDTDKKTVCSTWQSIYKMPAEYFAQYDAVIVDECHQADASSLKGIIEKLPHAKFRSGFTGTLDGTKTHELFMRGMFGKVIRPTTSRKLMDQGKMADINIRMLKLKYTEAECKAVVKLNYMDEIQFIVQHEKRNKLLVDTCLSFDKNVLLLFNFIEGHGQKLFDAAQEQAEALGKQVFFVYADTPVEERERIRGLVEKHDNIIIFATYALFSTGVNMKNLHYIIFGHPFKSRIRNLQSIGRGLRISEGKLSAVLVDICDDFTTSKKQNTAFIHAIDRLKIYESEQFKYEIVDVAM